MGWALVARALYTRKRREAEKLREQLLEEEHRAKEALEAKAAALAESNRLLDLAREAAETARATADEANKSKSAFLANMSHELRTPLNAIIGYSEMLQEEAEDVGQKEFVPDLEKIHGAGKHLLGLINDVLDLSKIESGKMTLYLEDFDVAKLVQEVAATVQPLIARKGNTLEVDCPPDLGTMHADLTKVRQTLFNLLSNASKFTEKGTITLRVKREKDSAIVDLHVSRFRHRHRDDAGTTGQTIPGLHPGRRFNEPEVRRHRTGPGDQPQALPTDGRGHHGGKRARQRQHLHCHAAGRGQRSSGSGGIRYHQIHSRLGTLCRAKARRRRAHFALHRAGD
jgi:hypothetical protein